MSNHLVIAGACVRQHVESARRAGLEPLGIDLFADWDTCQSAPCIRAQTLDEIAGIMDKHVRDHWVLTGGLEHAFLQVGGDQLPNGFLGPDLKAFKQISNSNDLAQLVSAIGFSFPLTSRQPFCPRGDWLQKPDLSAGGLRIRNADPGQRRQRGHHFQQRIPGTPVSAVFLTDSAGTHLLGASFQLLEQHFGRTTSAFAYAGSIGPLLLSSAVREPICRFGERLGSALPLKGVWGTDFIIGNGTLHPVDINPRMTASCDLFERAGQVPSFVSLHASACREPMGNVACDVPRQAHPSYIIGKAVAFSAADHPIEINPARHRQLVELRGSEPPYRLADIPAPGTFIPSHGPICTVYETMDCPGLRFGNDPQMREPRIPRSAEKMLNRLRKRVSNLNTQLECSCTD